MRDQLKGYHGDSVYRRPPRPGRTPRNTGRVASQSLAAEGAVGRLDA